MLTMRKGLLTSSIKNRFYVSEGKNVIDVSVPNLFEDIFTTILQPDYIYIYFCCLVWTIHSYGLFALIIFVSSVGGGVWDVLNKRRNAEHIRDMSRYVVDVNVLRDGKWKVMTSEDLLPGDVIELPGGGWKAPCDLVIIKGSAVVDESSLTGETVPIVKIQPGEHPSHRYDPDRDKKHTIYGGTIVVGAVGTRKMIQSPRKTTFPTPFKAPPTPGAYTLGKTPKVQTPKALLLVARTGWKTAKGSLIRSVLSVKQHEYTYEKEAKVFLFILIGVGALLFLFTIYLFGGFKPGGFKPKLLLYGFETIAILVPPMLPTLFHVGLAISASRLQELYEVFTTDSSRIPQSGKIDVMCFDKTGTLTKTDLDMMGVVLPTEEGFSDIQKVSFIKTEPLFTGLVTCHQLGELHPDLMGSRNDLKRTKQEETFMKKLKDFSPMKPYPKASPPQVQRYSGPVLDIKIFESTGWVYHDGDGEELFSEVLGKNGDKYEIMKRFDFDPSVQRMSVIIRNPKEDIPMVFCKGSPEAIKACCDPSSIPEKYSQEVKKHSRNGCYVLSLAYQPNPQFETPILETERLDVETNLVFLGFILLRNELKPDTENAIAELKKGRVRMSIITGDNIYTAVYIARQCGIISQDKKCFIGDMENGQLVFRDYFKSSRVLHLSHINPKEVPHTTITRSLPFATPLVVKRSGKSIKMPRSRFSVAITAPAYEYLYSGGHHDFLVNDVKVFARMKPLQKEAVIKLIADKGHVVGMCGDGANDCAALSAAHSGIALSSAEASVVSPFTAKRLSIQSVVDLIRESRACLANSFAIFKYTILYGITQTSQAVFCYWYGADLSELLYIIIDFIFFFPCAFFVTKCASSDYLLANPPTASIFGPRTQASLLGIVCIMLLSLFVSHLLLLNQSWYEPTNSPTTKYEVPEVTTTFLTGGFTYPAAAIACSFGGRWRRSVSENVGLMLASVTGIIILNAFLWLLPYWDPFGIYEKVKLVYLPTDFRAILFLVGLVMAIAILLWEFFIVHKIGDLMGEKYGFGRLPMDDEISSPAPTPSTIGVADDSSEDEELF
uniref:P-type ATPase A domain-containing protein n=1 Tax=Arcella intermedia TaxID=1963864 RepID=A0A6B2KX42_9EUKA|eukprot:TRINITY_DN16180_c0_g1_i1.p1 TRINITY_DN16180_c0_g1~~TRINITY_DN16180_c0_g1_i1.p1  ORF type:complete len:1060 (+),score=279.74 TRINITY_DN16180_c0_g1_i1:566-3745(+)